MPIQVDWLVNCVTYKLQYGVTGSVLLNYTNAAVRKYKVSGDGALQQVGQ